MSLRQQVLRLAVVCLMIGLAAWYALSGLLDRPLPAPPPGFW